MERENGFIQQKHREQKCGIKGKFSNKNKNCSVVDASSTTKVLNSHRAELLQKVGAALKRSFLQTSQDLGDKY